MTVSYQPQSDLRHTGLDGRNLLSITKKYRLTSHGPVLIAGEDVVRFTAALACFLVLVGKPFETVLGYKVNQTTVELNTVLTFEFFQDTADYLASSTEFAGKLCVSDL